MSKIRADSVRIAREKWNTAPPHIRVMATAYVEPLIHALEAIGAELDSLQHFAKLVNAGKIEKWEGFKE